MTAGVQVLAVVLALAGSACYGVAAVTQQRAAQRLPGKRAFDPAVLIHLARKPVWLAGLIAVGGGFAFQATALGLGPLIVVEPALATGLLFALVLAARRDHRRLRLAEWTAALAVVAGLTIFLIAGQPSGGQRTASPTDLGLMTAAVAALVGLCGLVSGWLTAAVRAVVLGIAGGAAAGATDALTKSVAVLANRHHFSLFADVRLYLLLTVGLLTYTIQQNGYRAGALAEFLPAFAVMEPICGSFLGLLIYREQLSDSPGQIAIELTACVVAIWGIARLAASGIIQDAPVPAGPEAAHLAEQDAAAEAADQAAATGPPDAIPASSADEA